MCVGNGDTIQVIFNTEAGNYYSKSTFIMTLIKQEKLVFILVILYIQKYLYWGVVAERSSLPDSSSGVSSRMWVQIPAVTLVSLSKTLNHNCFSPPRG